MGLVREVEWTQGGHRLYDESVFQRLSRIMELRKTKSLFANPSLPEWPGGRVRPRKDGFLDSLVAFRDTNEVVEVWRRRGGGGG